MSNLNRHQSSSAGRSGARLDILPDAGTTLGAIVGMSATAAGVYTGQGVGFKLHQKTRSSGGVWRWCSS